MKKKLKRVLVFALALSLCLTMTFPVFAESSDEATTKAMALKELGLFKGVSDTDFALDRAPTRTEALIMLIRALGKEQEALNNNWNHPFNDVDTWAEKYVGYGYEKGLTKGLTDTEFGRGNANSDMYLTFMLRALGYSDTAGDFVWSNPNTLAKATGILPNSVNTSNFLRSDVAIVSWASLEADLKGETLRFAKKLLADGIFSIDDYDKAIAQVGEVKPATISVSSFLAFTEALSNKSAEEIIIDSVGTPVIIVGEVTIPAGITLTVNPGNDFYIEGTLINNGTINVMGADSITGDFINYSVLSVQTGGRLYNNGIVNLKPCMIEDINDYGPIGGQLRVNGGDLNNTGSIFLKNGNVNTHGGMAAVIEGSFHNDGLVIVDGFFFRVEEGIFENNSGAVIINNTNFYAGEDGKFINNGKFSGKSAEK